MRTAADKDKVCQLYHQVFGADSPMYQPSHILRVATSHLQVGHTFLQRRWHVAGGGEDGGDAEGGVQVLHHSLGPLESLMTCVNMGWMAILVSPVVPAVCPLGCSNFSSTSNKCSSASCNCRATIYESSGACSNSSGASRKSISVQ